MAQIDFYHLQKQTLEAVLPKLLGKAYGTGKKIKVKIGNPERVEFINSILWTYEDESFLPHGSKKDGSAEEQPIWLTAGEDNPNSAEFLLAKTIPTAPNFCFWLTVRISARKKKHLLSECLIFLTAMTPRRLTTPARCGKT